MSTPLKNASASGFRDADVVHQFSPTPSSALHRPPSPAKAETAPAWQIQQQQQQQQHKSSGDPVEDVFLKPMAKPWTSPPATGGKSSRQPCYNITKTTSTSLLPPPPSQMVTSSTPLHFNNKNNINNLSSTGSPAPLMSAATTRQSLDLFHQNAARYQLEPRSSLITDFALSALKNSFSMSSLSQHCQSSGGGVGETGAGSAQTEMPSFTFAQQQTPDANARLRWERPFNSLTRLKDRGVFRAQWRRSFGASPLTSKEDVRQKENLSANGSGSGSGCNREQNADADWPALHANYTYLMSCDLIESCRSLNGEMSWDNGDLEHHHLLAPVDATTVLSGSLAFAANRSVAAVGCQTDAAEVTIAELQVKLQLLRDWLIRMEEKVPKLVLRPKWSKSTLHRRIREYKALHREIEGHSSEIVAACQRCAAWNPRQSRWLQNRYHRLLLRVLEWTLHLEALAKKPPEFWSGRRAAANSPESQFELPCKYPRLDGSLLSEESTSNKIPDRRHIHHDGNDIDVDRDRQVEDRSLEEMRQSNAEGGLSPPLPAAVPPANMGIYEFKHADTDTENPRPQDHSSEDDVRVSVSSSQKRLSIRSRTHLARSNDSSENEWVYSPNNSASKSLTVDDIDRSAESVRKKLSFDSDEDNASSSKSWYQYSSSESDWLQGGTLDLEEMSDPEPELAPEQDEPLVPSPAHFASADLPEESAHKDEMRVYNKEKVHKMVTEAEQMVAGAGEISRGIPRVSEARYNSECDASSELTSEGESDDGADVPDATNSNGRKSASLNRTFMLPNADAIAAMAESSPVVMRNHRRTKAQRPLSLSGLTGVPFSSSIVAGSSGCNRGSNVNHGVSSGDYASSRWAASETALNHLVSSPTLSPGSASERPFMCNASTQKDRLSPSTEGLGSSLAGLSSCGSASGSGARPRRRRHSARHRTLKSMQRRSELDVHSGGSDSNNATLQARLSASAASASSSGEASSTGTGSHRSRRIVKSTTLTRISVEQSSPVAVATGHHVVQSTAQSSPLKLQAASSNSSPRSAPSDGELCLGHADETSNFSEQAWDNYLDRYASEAYSEDADAESARRLLEFGEDYRNDLDSLSDCPSSLSNELRNFRPHYPHKRSPPKRPKGFGSAERSVLTEMRMLDSDSDVDDLVHVVETSASQYGIALNTFHKVLNTSRLEPSQYAELLATCRTNVECLQAILSHLKMSENDLEARLPAHHELKPVGELIAKWTQLDSEVAPLHQEAVQQRQLQLQVQAVRHKLHDLDALVSEAVVHGDFQLNLSKIHQLKAQIDAEKESLLNVNVAVHSCIADQLPSAKGINLKEDVAGLYQIWEQLMKNVTKKESLLTEAEQTWKDFQRQLGDLKAEIAADQKKVQSIIDLQVVKSSETSSSSDNHQGCQTGGKWTTTKVGGIQCDSGISSGSDGEFISVGEREKRLNTLRQLARKLETALAPSSTALMLINETLDETQKELKLLHNQLSHLPPVSTTTKHVSTAVPPVKEMSVQSEAQSIKKKQRDTRVPAPVYADACSTLPYCWRIFRAALPFHLALLALIVAACVMEPSCCNYLNNFGSSLVPKLSYLGGPPPI